MVKIVINRLNFIHFMMIINILITVIINIMLLIILIVIIIAIVIAIIIIIKVIIEIADVILNAKNLDCKINFFLIFQN